jgi:hypothetical protein
VADAVIEAPLDSYANAFTGCLHVGEGAGRTCMDDLVVDQCALDVETSLPLDLLLLHNLWTMFRR